MFIPNLPLLTWILFCTPLNIYKSLCLSIIHTRVYCNTTIWRSCQDKGAISSATKKVRKVDIRYALRTFQIFWYTFGTHLTQKVDIFITSDKIADTIRISVSIVVILSISRIPQYYWCNLSSRNFLFQN